MVNRKIIFIGGIHGVGKGTICKTVAKKYELQHLTASEVLKWTEISMKENKKVENISSTQNRLIANLNQIVRPDESYLLDGHFTLLDSEGNPEFIPESTFEEINPISLMIVIGEPKTIQERLARRDSFKYEIDILKKMQEMEISHAEFISNKLSIPLIKIENNELQPIHDYFQEI